MSVSSQEGLDHDLVFASHDAPRASIVVSGWKSAPTVERCLASIASHVRGVSYEVIVSLSEASPAVKERLERSVRGARILAWNSNVGFAGTCNRAVAAARGEYVVLLNDDAEVEEGWLETLVDTAELHPEAGAIGSRVLLPDGTMQENGVVIWSDGTVTFVGYRQAPEDFVPDGVTRVDYCSGVSLLVPRRVWISIGGMDEGYFPAYYEDVDLCLKLEAKGFQVLVQPASVVHHHGSTSPLKYREFLGNRNRRRLVARWGPLLERRPPPKPDDPAAIMSAFEEVRRRPMPGAVVPALADERFTEVQDGDGSLLRRELALKDEFASEIVADLDARLDEIAELRTEIIAERTRSADSASEIAALRTLADQLELQLESIKDRAGYRLVDRVYSAVRRVPGVFQMLRWLVRAAQRGRTRRHSNQDPC